MTSHWGEFTTPKTSQEGQETEEVIPAEIVKFFIMKAMQQDPFRTPLPTTSTTPAVSNIDLALKTKGLKTDDRVLLTIKLQQYSREMNKLIETTREQTEHTRLAPPPLEIPQHPVPENQCSFNFPLHYMDKDFSDFTTGKAQPVPEVTSQTARKLLRKSVAALLAHAGFENTPNSVLCSFADVAEEYIKKMTSLLRVAVDQGANAMATGFPDAMERVFHEMNIGSARCLHDYYQNKVIKHHQNVLDECNRLGFEYTNIAIPIKKLEEPNDIPELHLSGLCDGDGVDDLQPSLETGFQMLHSLEHLQSLDSQDEELVHSTDSPLEASSLLSFDLQSHLSKKRKRM